VRRLNESPRAAELFLLDPVGALASVGILLSQQAIAEWNSLVGGTLPEFPKQNRDLMLRSTVPIKTEVTIHGILPPPTRSPEETSQGMQVPWASLADSTSSSN